MEKQKPHKTANFFKDSDFILVFEVKKYFFYFKGENNQFCL